MKPLDWLPPGVRALVGFDVLVIQRPATPAACVKATRDSGALVLR